MWFSYVSQIFYEISALSEFFIWFGKFRHRTAPIVRIVSKPNLFVLIYLLVFGYLFYIAH